MSQSPHEPEVTGQGKQEPVTPAVTEPANEPAGHPAWQPILEQIPEDFRGLVKPAFEDWDKGVQAKFQEIHGRYDPYKEFAENKVDPALISQSLYLMDQLNGNPQEVLDQLIEAFNLKDQYGKQTVTPPVEPQNAVPDFDPDDDIMGHPVVKAMQESLNKLTQAEDNRQQETQQQQGQRQLQETLDGLKAKHGEFDPTYVVALMSQGVDGDVAVKQYMDTVNQAAARIAGQTQQQTQQAPPTVLSAGGEVGSGVPQQPLDMGKMSDRETKDLVAEFIKKSQSNES